MFIGGTSTSTYQIPNNPGQPPGTSSGGNNFVTYPFDSANLNERQTENNQFGVLAYQKSIDGLDLQLAYFTRYSTLHFMPDYVGDLAFNGVASDVYRRSLTNGIQADSSYKLTGSHTLRFGFQVSGEQSLVSNTSAVLPVDASGNTTTDTPFMINDSSSKLGWLLSTYASDEWKITNQVTLNTGLRFDQMYSCTDANQLAEGQRHLQTVRWHHLPRRLRAQLHPAAAGAGGADQSRAGQRHHPAAGGEPE